MHRRALNHARLTFGLRPRGPLLVKSGLESADPTRPGMEFVRTRHPLVGETIYLPGTSLKGALRSQAERVLRGLNVDACNPFDKSSGCRSNVSGEQSPATYRRQCPVCRTFGSLSLTGRCSLSDAYPWDPRADDATREEQFTHANATERRVQVGISRQDGSTADGTLFDLEVAVAGAFWGEARLDNFELWQLGLLAAVLDDVHAGDVPIGFGKSRGLGQMSVDLIALDCEWLAAGGARDLPGAGALTSEDERRAYGLRDNDKVRLPAGCEATSTWRGRRLTVSGAPLAALVEDIKSGPLTAKVSQEAPRERR